MKKLIKDALLDALLSGQYPKGQDELRCQFADYSANTLDPKLCEEFCIMGVVGDLYIQANPGQARWASDLAFEHTEDHGGTHYAMPDAVLKWAGLTEQDQNALININDSKLTWRPVIQYIQENL